MCLKTGVNSQEDRPLGLQIGPLHQEGQGRTEHRVPGVWCLGGLVFLLWHEKYQLFLPLEATVIPPVANRPSTWSETL